MSHAIDWSRVTAGHVAQAAQEFDSLGADAFFAQRGFAPATTYNLVHGGRDYPPKAILGAAFEIATGQRLQSTDFEGGKSGAVKVLTQLGFSVLPKRM
ncbi:MAG TPA: hypothetical protein VGM38_06745 [Pseudolysinimonas sp.]|jgi:hypothetical protein